MYYTFNVYPLHHGDREVYCSTYSIKEVENGKRSNRWSNRGQIRGLKGEQYPVKEGKKGVNTPFCLYNHPHDRIMDPFWVPFGDPFGTLCGEEMETRS